TFDPFFRYFSAISARRSLKITTPCHSVRSLRSPDTRSRQLSEVAAARLAMRMPSWVERSSGSRPRLPIRITLLTLPAIGSPPCRIHQECPSYQTCRMFLLHSSHGQIRYDLSYPHLQSRLRCHRRRHRARPPGVGGF